jgi:hypothetical protein
VQWSHRRRVGISGETGPNCRGDIFDNNDLNLDNNDLNIDYNHDSAAVAL